MINWPKPSAGNSTEGSGAGICTILPLTAKTNIYTCTRLRNANAILLTTRHISQ